MKKKVTWILVLLLAIFLVGCNKEEKKEVDETASPKLEIADEEKVDKEQTVVIVNGDEVKGTVYNLVYTQLKLHAMQLGKETELDELKDATITSLIDRQIVLQEAREEGIEVTDEEADTELKALKEESSEALSTLLEQYQISEAEFKEQLKFELTMNEYVAKTVKVTVSDDELKDYYEKAKEGNDSIPEFDEIKDQLKKQLLNQKTMEEFQSNIDKIKEKATIEKKI